MKSLLGQLPPPPPGRTGWPWTVETPPSVYADRTDWPRISIVTPSYGQADYVEETIRSILLQNYPNLDYVVMDGGSTDGTLEILKRYSPWLKHWESVPDQGQSHAINKGLTHCDGVWFNWINSDDCLLPAALAAIGRVNTAASLISACELTGPTLESATPLGRTRIGSSLEDTVVNHVICQQGLFIRTEVVKALGGVREDMHYIMDLDLFARALLKQGLDSVCELDEGVAFFRRHDQAKTCRASDKFIVEEQRMFHGIGTALQLSPRLLATMAQPLPPVETSDLSRLDRKRISEALAVKFWVEGRIEVAWQERDFPTFKRELTDFRHEFPDLRNQRITRLRLMSLLPECALKVISRLLRSPS
jgi:hypothetical protein